MEKEMRYGLPKGRKSSQVGGKNKRRRIKRSNLRTSTGFLRLSAGKRAPRTVVKKIRDEKKEERCGQEDTPLCYEQVRKEKNEWGEGRTPGTHLSLRSRK